VVMARAVMMGNARHLVFECPECGHHNAVTAPHGSNVEQLEGFRRCLWCEDRLVVDVDPREK